MPVNQTAMPPPINMPQPQMPAPQPNMMNNFNAAPFTPNTNISMPPPQPSNAMSFSRPPAEQSNLSLGRANNPMVGNPNKLMSTKVSEFKPAFNTNIPSFQPSFTPPVGVGGGSSLPAAWMNKAAPSFQPSAPPPKPAEPPKEKIVLKLESIVKSSDTDVKSD